MNPLNASELNNKSFVSSATNCFMDKVSVCHSISRVSDWHEF